MFFSQKLAPQKSGALGGCLHVCRLCQEPALNSGNAARPYQMVAPLTSERTWIQPLGSVGTFFFHVQSIQAKEQSPSSQDRMVINLTSRYQRRCYRGNGVLKSAQKVEKNSFEVSIE